MSVDTGQRNILSRECDEKQVDGENLRAEKFEQCAYYLNSLTNFITLEELI